MSNELYYLIESGSALAAVKSYIEDRQRVHQNCLDAAKELGVDVASYDRDTHAFKAVEFKDRSSVHIDFTLPKRNNNLSYPKKGTEWDRRFKTMGLKRTAEQIIHDLFKIPSTISFSKSGTDTYGSRMIGDRIQQTGFLFLSPNGPFALYAPDVKLAIKQCEDEGYTVNQEIKDYDDNLPGCTKINKEDWDLLVAKHQAKKAAESHAKISDKPNESPPINPALSFQENVNPWMEACFSNEVCSNLQERNNRFLEEALELVQSGSYTAEQAHAMVDYVFNRPTGEMKQEVGGVMVTLAALCSANNIDMHDCGDTELTRVWSKIDQIRSKQGQKPKHLAL